MYIIYIYYVYVHILCIWVFSLYVCLCTTYMCGARARLKALNLLGLELQIVVSHLWVLGIKTLVLWKNNKCSKPLSHISSPLEPLKTPLVCVCVCDQMAIESSVY